jgi:ABC-type cobalt transport system, ATPase component
MSNIDRFAAEALELNNICYAYEGSTALDSISMKIRKGEAVAFMGPNGSGKSTLLKIINGLIFPDSGSYFFCGDEVTEKKMKDSVYAKSLHKRIGFIFQNSDAQLFNTTVYDEIAFGPRQMGMDEEAAGKRTDDCISMLGIEHLRERSPYHLSGGEKHKVAIASVLALNPELLVLDEPMIGLDPRSQRWLVDFLAQMNEAGKTIITSTHNLDLVQEVSDRTILFGEDHKILADSKTADILGNQPLLVNANLVDEYYHMHHDNGHVHFHDHE